MIVLGLILIVLAVAAGALLFVGTQPLTEPVDLEAVGVTASVLPLVLLIAGAAVMLLFLLGLAMIRGSVRRKTRRRRESKELERKAEHEAQARREAEKRAAATPVAPLASAAPSTREETRRPEAEQSEQDLRGGSDGGRPPHGSRGARDPQLTRHRAVGAHRSQPRPRASPGHGRADWQPRQPEAQRCRDLDRDAAIAVRAGT